jgi:Trk K+ transport system NAD-binding subunit
VTEGSPHSRRSRWARWRYRANLVWDRGTWPVLLAVGALTLLVVIASTAVLVLTNSVFKTEHGRSVAERFWQSLLRVIDPGTMATDVHWGPRLLSLLVTIFGIVLFGTLIGTISTAMQGRLGTLRRGRTIVLEAGHIVILGWSPWVGLLVDDLTVTVGRRRRQTIVILAAEDRASMEELLRATIGDRRGLRLICRHGDPTVASELHRVNVREARTVVAVGSEDPTSDATVAATVLAVGVACDGFTHQTVVAEVDDPAAAQTLTDACEGQVEVVGDDVIADMLAMWMARPGAAELVRELLSAEHVQLSFSELPEAAGRSFATVSVAVDDALPIGIRSAGGTVSLIPPPDTIVEPGDELVCLGEGSHPRWDGSLAAAGPAATAPPARPVTPATAPLAATGSSTTASPAAAGCTATAPPPIPSVPQRLMVIGWNRMAPGLLSKLDPLLAAGSTLTVLCDSDLVSAAEIVVPPLEHLTVDVTTVPEPELEVVSALADGACSAIAVLAHQGVAPKDADAITLAALMAVRRAATTTGRPPGPFVVAELTDSKHDELAVFAGAHETVARSALLGDAIAFAAVSPRARPIVAALQTPHGPTVRLIAAIDLGLVGEHTVAAIAAAAHAHGVLAIGTRRRTPTDTDTPGLFRPQLQLHVHRTETVRLGEDDEVVVVG